MEKVQHSHFSWSLPKWGFVLSKWKLWNRLLKVYFGGDKMNGYIAFVKRIYGKHKNYRFLSCLRVFLTFGIASAFLCKIHTRDFISFSCGYGNEFRTRCIGCVETILQKYLRCWFPVHLLFLYGSCLSTEYSKGTLILMVTKGCHVKAVILAKFTVAAILMTLCYWVSYGAAYGYTAYLWDNTNLPDVAFAAFALWIAGFLYLSILMVGCVIFKQTFTNILLQAVLPPLSLYLALSNLLPASIRLS